MTRYVGLDAHSKFSVYVIQDEDGPGSRPGPRSDDDRGPGGPAHRARAAGGDEGGPGERHDGVLRRPAAGGAGTGSGGGGCRGGAGQGDPAEPEERPAGRPGALRGTAPRDLPHGGPRAAGGDRAAAQDAGPAAALRADEDHAGQRREAPAAHGRTGHERAEPGHGEGMAEALRHGRRRRAARGVLPGASRAVALRARAGRSRSRRPSRPRASRCAAISTGCRPCPAWARSWR